jgi:hypothetical protein
LTEEEIATAEESTAAGVSHESKCETLPAFGVPYHLWRDDFEILLYATSFMGGSRPPKYL